MAASVYIDPPMADELTELLAAEGIVIASDSSSASLTIGREDRRQSDLKTLYAGGWVACETALALADRLGISPASMGKLIDLLDVKVRRCSLGCF